MDAIHNLFTISHRGPTIEAGSRALDFRQLCFMYVNRLLRVLDISQFMIISLSLFSHSLLAYQSYINLEDFGSLSMSIPDSWPANSNIAKLKLTRCTIGIDELFTCLPYLETFHLHSANFEDTIMALSHHIWESWSTSAISMTVDLESSIFAKTEWFRAKISQQKPAVKTDTVPAFIQEVDEALSEELKWDINSSNSLWAVMSWHLNKVLLLKSWRGCSVDTDSRVGGVRTGM
uniref:Uncharacterized protein n=1 Tax=Chenopodium quinoa TaxID=63459 RepID=A0A803MIH6_CHEQI